MSGHTSGPWWVDVHGSILSPGGKMVAFPCISGGLPHKANAARIVQCVNSHDELLGALRTYVAYDEYINGADGDSSTDRLQIARAAIARATAATLPQGDANG